MMKLMAGKWQSSVQGLKLCQSAYKVERFLDRALHLRVLLGGLNNKGSCDGIE